MLQMLVKCGGIDIPTVIPKLTSYVVTFMKIVIPIALVILGMLDLGKAVMASKEDEIKKAQQLFIKRLIAAIVVFLIVTIVQIFFNILAGAGAATKSDWNSCINCFFTGNC